LGPRIGNIFCEEWVSHAATDNPWASMCQAVDVTGWLGGIGLWRVLLGCVEVRGTKGTYLESVSQSPVDPFGLLWLFEEKNGPKIHQESLPNS